MLKTKLKTNFIIFIECALCQTIQGTETVRLYGINSDRQQCSKRRDALSSQVFDFKLLLYHRLQSIITITKHQIFKD